MQLQAIKKLTLSQWAWILEAYWRLWPVQIRIRWGQPTWLFSKLELVESAVRRAPQAAQSNEQRAAVKLAEQLHESVRLAARCHFWQTACLPRSITLAAMLNRRGVPAIVKVGVDKPAGAAGSLVSHAWVEVQGQMINEPEQVAALLTPIMQGVRR